MVDPDARRIHDLEQVKRALEDVAPLMVHFTDELEKAGYSRSEAVRGASIFMGIRYRPKSDIYREG